MGMKVLLLACMVVLVTAMSASAASECYVSVTGANQGPFKGELLVKGLEGKFAGRSFDFEVVSPRDPQTGMTSGKPMHRPIRIQKAWGPASLQFYSALLKNEPLAVTIDFVTQDQSGVMVLDHSVKLTGAVVASFSSHSEGGQLPVTDTIELVFQKAEIIDHKTKAMVSSN